jgi:hypothetical protein
MTRSPGGLELACKNGTVIITLGRNANYNETTRTFRVVAKHEGSDQQAVWYIVVVLLFYSIGIVIAIVTYLKREREEVEEQKSYEDYYSFKLDPGRHSRQHRVKLVAMKLKEMEEERQRKNRSPLEKDRPRRPSKKRYGRSHSWHFGTFSPFSSPTRSPTSPNFPTESSITHNLRLTLPAYLGPPGLPTRQAISLNVTPTIPNPQTSFLPTNKNGGIRRALSLNSPYTRLAPSAPTQLLRSHPDIFIASPSNTGAREPPDSPVTASDSSSETKGTTAVVYKCTSPDLRRTLVTNL